MKGFPNQVADLAKLAKAIKIIQELLSEDKNPKNDGVYGEALVRADIIRTGHTPLPIEEYLNSQKLKPLSNQSHRTLARGLKELFRILDLIKIKEEAIELTPKGEKIASIANQPLNEITRDIWRNIIIQMQHKSVDETASHPYQVLLRLIARCPGITRAKCALALEAKDDSDEELNRILNLVPKDENEIISTIRTTKNNWDNGKKILPHFAEQLNDVWKEGQQFYLNPLEENLPQGTPAQKADSSLPRKRRGASLVTADTIAKAGMEDSFDEKEEEYSSETPESIKEKHLKIKKRLFRHNKLVKQVASILESKSAKLYEYPFDCLACFTQLGFLIEVKTLDGTEADEVDRVRDALSQLLYYESFVITSFVKEEHVIKIACFENKISNKHIEWLAKSGILTIWANNNNSFEMEEKNKQILEKYFK